jgi:sugar O-acyltransferase (sialic acid O-acetyltransferase NeuD family)
MNNIKNIAIYGAGGFGKEIACLINLINKNDIIWNIIGYFDDDIYKKGTFFYGFEVIGGIEELNNITEPISIVFSIGNPSIVKNIFERINNINISYPNIISTDCIFLDSNTTKLGKGNIIMPQSLISCNVRISDFNLMNCGTSIGHDTMIGSYNSFMSYSKISGEVTIGDSNYFGACSLVLQRKNIGNFTTIGANSVVMRNTVDENTYLGNPAVKILKPKSNI